MEDIKKTFGRNVRKYREQLEWTQAELAEKIDISTAFMTHIEHGTRGVSMETVEILARTFGICYADLFEEDSSKKSKINVKLAAQKFKKELVSYIAAEIDNFFESEAFMSP
uniref:HTH cro/C1-type domain-containing protein n=1 Tax=uncultured Spirochaetaceae bacterium TaxID=201186 RepID=A0A650F5C1_9SPIO|nr:hypothetical protein Unknown280_0870 [uncultured Spirochaetaceae bacterium]